jgi:hypothetical protein
MTVVVRFTDREEVRALPILLRHSPGVALPSRTYVLRPAAIEALRAARIAFTLIARL